jgi:hypothetical protein
MSGTQDIVGGLPRVTEIVEARKPKEPGHGGDFRHRRDSRRQAQAAR